jgi:4a-hydroxytetrahydrobiopterin dehydratase
MTMKAFTKDEIVSYMSLHLKKWTFTETSIKRELKFKTFVEAFSFMTSIALEAEKMDHHPDWKNVYNTVIIDLNTHSARGITQLDYDLAKKIDSTYKNYEQ